MLVHLQIATSMVAVTFLSAPLMLISAKMITLVHINPLDYVKELQAFLFHVSIAGMVASVSCAVVPCVEALMLHQTLFLLSKHFKKKLK